MSNEYSRIGVLLQHDRQRVFVGGGGSGSGVSMERAVGGGIDCQGIGGDGKTGCGPTAAAAAAAVVCQLKETAAATVHSTAGYFKPRLFQQ